MANPHDPTRPSEPAQSVPRIGPGLEGRAVRLSALAQWLANRDDIAPQDAWGRLFNDLARLEPGAVRWLALDSEGYGQPLPVHDEWFATNNGAPGFANGRRVFSRGIGRYTPPPDPAPSLGRGAEGFASWLRWCTELRPFLIVAESVARRLWGWGSGAAHADGAAQVSPFPLADFDALATYRKAQKAANVAAGKRDKTIPWTDGNQLDLLRGEYARLGGHPGAAVSIAKDLGTTRQAVVAALKKERKRKAPSPLPSLGTSRAA